MKTLISQTLWQIIRNPQANKILEAGIAQLNANKKDESPAVTITIGKRTYQIAFLNLAGHSAKERDR